MFVSDYPKRWPNFFTDLLQTLSLGPRAIDLYLRVLLAIDSEVVDREILHSKEEADRNTLIKDHMRETCVDALVDSWFHILVNNKQYQNYLVIILISLKFVFILNSLLTKHQTPTWFVKPWKSLGRISHGSTLR